MQLNVSIQNDDLYCMTSSSLLIISMGFLFIDQELQRLKIGMKSLVAANDEKVSDRESGNLFFRFLGSTAVCD